MKRSVLVVDDEPNIVVSLEFLLKKAGYDVRVARNGEKRRCAPWPSDTPIWSCSTR